MKIVDFYKKQAPSFGLAFHKDEMHIAATGKQATATILRGGRRKKLPLASPNADTLFGRRNDNIIVYHPLAENMFEKAASPVLNRTVSLASTDVAIRLAVLMCNSVGHALKDDKLTAGQQRVVKNLTFTKGIGKEMPRIYEAIVGDTKEFAKIRIIREDEDTESGAFKGVFSVPAIRELEDFESIAGIKVKSAKDRDNLLKLIRRLTGLEDTEDREIEIVQHSKLAPRFIALCHVMHKANEIINTNAKLLETKKSPNIRDNSWFEQMGDLAELFNKEAKIRPVGNNASDNDTDRGNTYKPKQEVSREEQDEINASVRTGDIEIDVVEETVTPVAVERPVVQPETYVEPQGINMYNQQPQQPQDLVFDEFGRVVQPRQNMFAGRIKKLGEVASEPVATVNGRAHPQAAPVNAQPAPQQPQVRRAATRPAAHAGRKAVDPNAIGRPQQPHAAPRKKITEVQAVDINGVALTYSDNSPYIVKGSNPQIDFILATFPNGTPKYDDTGAPVLLPATTARGHMAAATANGGANMSPREFALAVANGTMMPDGSPVQSMNHLMQQQYQPTNAREAMLMQRQAHLAGTGMRQPQQPQPGRGMYDPRQALAQYENELRQQVQYGMNQGVQRGHSPMSSMRSAIATHNQGMMDTSLDAHGNFRP